jgi:hypothetical protein
MRKAAIVIIPFLMLVTALTVTLLLKDGAVSHIDTDEHNERLDAAMRAVRIGPPGALSVERLDLFPPVIHGIQSRSGSRISFAMVFQRCFDLSDLPSRTDEAGGVMAVLLESAEAHRRELASVGFAPIEGHGQSFGQREPHPDRSLHVTVVERGEGTSGRGGYLVNLNHPRLVHHRIYLHPQSGSTVFVRQDYDDETKRLFVELSYADQTILGQVYDDEPWELSETIDHKDE